MTHHRYRTVVGGIGIVYDGLSSTEAYRKFNLFVAESETEGSAAAGKLVTVFKDYEIVREYFPPDRE
jgi:hypothetical protein